MKPLAAWTLDSFPHESKFMGSIDFPALWLKTHFIFQYYQKFSYIFTSISQRLSSPLSWNTKEVWECGLCPNNLSYVAVLPAFPQNDRINSLRKKLQRKTHWIIQFRILLLFSDIHTNEKVNTFVEIIKPIEEKRERH